ncbi:MAG: hypothetical protein HQK96_19320 [Nitrospirae bacterium]|nr:hypothetical protein [Nitrospirota bacterium]
MNKKEEPVEPLPDKASVSGGGAKEGGSAGGHEEKVDVFLMNLQTGVKWVKWLTIVSLTSLLAIVLIVYCTCNGFIKSQSPIDITNSMLSLGSKLHEDKYADKRDKILNILSNYKESKIYGNLMAIILDDAVRIDIDKSKNVNAKKILKEIDDELQHGEWMAPSEKQGKGETNEFIVDDFSNANQSGSQIHSNGRTWSTFGGLRIKLSGRSIVTTGNLCVFRRNRPSVPVMSTT